MRITNVRNFRNHATAYLKADEPVLVTRHGKVAGLLLPLAHPEHLPMDLRKEILVSLGEYLNKSLELKKISEERIIGDFEEYRKARS